MSPEVGGNTLISKMDKNIKNFLERNLCRPAPKFITEFTEILQRIATKNLQASRITRYVFEITSSTMSEEDKNKLK